MRLARVGTCHRVRALDLRPAPSRSQVLCSFVFCRLADFDIIDDGQRTGAFRQARRHAFMLNDVRVPGYGGDAALHMYRELVFRNLRFQETAANGAFDLGVAGFGRGARQRGA